MLTDEGREHSGNDLHPRHHHGYAGEMKAMMSFIVTSGIQPEVGLVSPMAEAREAIGSMIAGHTKGKTVFHPVT